MNVKFKWCNEKKTKTYAQNYRENYCFVNHSEFGVATYRLMNAFLI